MRLRLPSALLLDFLLLLLDEIEQLIIGIGPSGLFIFVVLRSGKQFPPLLKSSRTENSVQTFLDKPRLFYQLFDFDQISLFGTGRFLATCHKRVTPVFDFILQNIVKHLFLKFCTVRSILIK